MKDKQQDSHKQMTDTETETEVAANDHYQYNFQQRPKRQELLWLTLNKVIETIKKKDSGMERMWWWQNVWSIIYHNFILEEEQNKTLKVSLIIPLFIALNCLNCNNTFFNSSWL